MILSKGILVFDPPNTTKKHKRQGVWKKTAMIMVDDDTCAYYRWLIQKRFPFIQGVQPKCDWLNPPLRGTHVTIINDKILNNKGWEEIKKRFHGTQLDFWIDVENGLRHNGEHIYYKVDCPDGHDIRRLGGLPKPYFGFHLTVGLIDLQSESKREHSKWVQKYMINERENHM